MIPLETHLPVDLMKTLLYPTVFHNIITEYLLTSSTKNNCHFACHPQCPISYLVSNQDIPPGSELTVSYGPLYWFTLEYHKSSSDFNQLLNSSLPK